MMKRLRVFMLSLCALYCCNSFPAVDGTLGTLTTGVVLISITIPALVQISGLQDINLGSPSTYPITGVTSACIYSNVVSPIGSYYVTATSSHPSGAGDFQVSNGANTFIYTAFWNDSSATTAGGEKLTSALKTSQQMNGNYTSPNCGGGGNANFNVRFDEASIQAAPPSATAYTDQVTLLITPS